MAAPDPSPSRRPVRTLLVANRGEIARRIMITARAMGITTVAVHADPDAGAPHVAEADLAVRLPGAAPGDTYLRTDLLLDAAARAGADAVHPGYGFLSESATFAAAVVDAGLTWVGPPPKAIEAMGSKVGAKALMAAAGVPTLPAVTIAAEGDAALPGDEELEPLGWPLLVKASAGGGGRGMRVVTDRADLGAAIDSARREAASAFGDGTVFLERYVTDPRHIEVQVLADAQGTTLALFERECSIQRRHQKIVEEAPSPVVGPELRDRLSQAAVAAARAVGYVNAGTVEFVLDTSGPEARPFFLEMNTRLQVEHPVTEAVTGLDLVRLQLLVAGGEPLPAEVHEAVDRGPRGHAVEVRLYAEDPARGWLPSTGTLERFRVPGSAPLGAPPASAGATLRLDAGVVEGETVSPHYDPMLAKLIAHAPTRDEAAAALAGALAGARLCGVTTNRDLLVRTLRHPEFAAARTDTGFLDRIGLDVLAAPLRDDRPGAGTRHAVAAALAGQHRRRRAARVQASLPSGFRNNPSGLQTTTFALGGAQGGAEVVVGYRMGRDGRRIDRLEVDGLPPGDHVAVTTRDGDEGPGGDTVVTLEVDGVARTYRVAHDPGSGTWWVDGPDGSSTLVERDRFPAPDSALARGAAVAPMPGGVVAVAVAEGDRVEAGDVLVVVEAMKMEHAVHAAAAGRVGAVAVAVGDQVETGQVLLTVEGDGDEEDGTDSGDRGGGGDGGASPGEAGR